MKRTLMMAGLLWAACTAGAAGFGSTPNQVFGQRNFWENYSGLGPTPNSVNYSSGLRVCWDGQRLFAADPNRNRVLVWNSRPTRNNQAPDLVIGQADCMASSPAYFNYPYGVASDGQHLVVADTSNNRVLIWNSIPSTSNVRADVVVGQAVTYTTASGTSDHQLFAPQAVLIDNGRLFIADTNNHRVLVYNHLPASNGAAADAVIGQTGFNLGMATSVSITTMAAPKDLASGAGRLWVADSYNRVVGYPLGNILTFSTPADTLVGNNSFYTTSSGIAANRFGSIMGIACDGRRLLVSDAANRILVWDSIPSGASDVGADHVLGQSNFTTTNSAYNQSEFASPTCVRFMGDAIIAGISGSFYSLYVWNQAPRFNGAAADLVIGNQWAGFGPAPGPGFSNTDGTTMNSPRALSWDGNRLFVADSSNNRILVWNRWPEGPWVPADLVLGQTDLRSTSSGYGRTNLNNPQGVFSDGTRLFVSDTGNNRVLVWLAKPMVNAQPADLVLGQPDFSATSTGLTQNKLSGPLGLRFDGTRLAVADSASNRVLIWNSLPAANGANADIVLGQVNFTSSASGSSATGMMTPSDVQFAAGKLVVAEGYSGSRVKVFNDGPGLVSSCAAVAVWGQSGFGTNTTNEGGLTAASMGGPVGLAWDGTYLYVVDYFDNRVQAFSGVPTTNKPAPDFILGQPGSTSNSASNPDLKNGYNAPYGIAAGPDRLLVADWANNRVVAYGHTVAPSAPLPSYASAPAPKVGPVPARQGQDICLGSDVKAASAWQVFNLAGDLVAEVKTGQDQRGCLQTGQLAPGMYFARVSTTYPDGSVKTATQKIAIVK